jgi:hypothetical protein
MQGPREVIERVDFDFDGFGAIAVVLRCAELMHRLELEFEILESYIVRLDLV